MENLGAGSWPSRRAPSTGAESMADLEGERRSALQKLSAEFPDLKQQAVFRRQGDGGADARRLKADVLGAETAQQDRQSQRILDLAHRAADARAFAATERNVAVFHLLLGVAGHPPIWTELFGLFPEFRVVMRAVSKQRDAVAWLDRDAADFVFGHGHAD